MKTPMLSCFSFPSASPMSLSLSHFLPPSPFPIPLPFLSLSLSISISPSPLPHPQAAPARSARRGRRGRVPPVPHRRRGPRLRQAARPGGGVRGVPGQVPATGVAEVRRAKLSIQTQSYPRVLLRGFVCV